MAVVLFYQKCKAMHLIGWLLINFCRLTLEPTKVVLNITVFSFGDVKNA